MMDPMPNDLEEVLAPERPIPPVDEAVQARMAARLAASLGAPGIAADLRLTKATPGLDTVRPPRLRGWLWKVGLATLTVLTAAVIVGSRDDRPLEVAAPSAEPLERPLATQTAEPAPDIRSAPARGPAVELPTHAASCLEPDDLPDAAPARSAARSAPAASSSASANAMDDALRRERALTDAARMAIGRGDAPGALEQLATAMVEFPTGRLAQEREALTVQALWISGQHQQARKRARAFRERFPVSPLLHSIEALVGSEPVQP